MDLDHFISDVLQHKEIEEADLTCVLRMAEEILFEEGTFLNISLPITICGDIHGQFYDLLRLFKIGGDPSTTRYLFLGDYVDRGYYSLETFALLISYKVKYPHSFFLLRGNHESRGINILYGFYDEIIQRYGHTGLWKLCNEIFDMLPMAALIDNSIYCVHGGLSPDIRLIDQLAMIDRRHDIPPSGPMSDICWSDPEDILYWGSNMRGAGWLYGRNPTNEFIHNNRLTLIVRAHQLMNEGYSYHFGGNYLVTVWSAPNYMYRAGNIASILKINEKRERKFLTFSAVPANERKVPPDRISSYFL
ncbi:serine/threonine protein phosphatase Ppe1 [Histomonas meleagridis]|uniref:serine/threonine protein phosphatase Ppe1 n=1 Tax=Histomonas meleagridis TaxID=135588 RepID=UPI00355A5B2D|nr:serine/threonine protein phosphatase Ppe1 [Histomonas meleagridis]KAH0805143.1 serine/threonine protein phosphatase Ppe1 [Histomonas meleagridis]